MAEQEESWYAKIGMVLGGLTALGTFVVVMILACKEAGWVVGIALGWIPAGLAAAIMFAIVRFLWPVGVLGAVALYDEFQKTL